MNKPAGSSGPWLPRPMLVGAAARRAPATRRAQVLLTDRHPQRVSSTGLSRPPATSQELPRGDHRISAAAADEFAFCRGEVIAVLAWIALVSKCRQIGASVGAQSSPTPPRNRLFQSSGHPFLGHVCFFRRADYRLILGNKGFTLDLLMAARVRMRISLQTKIKS